MTRGTFNFTRLNRRDALKGAGAGLASAAIFGPSGRRAFARQDEPVTVTFWHYYGGATTAALEGVLQRYEDSHPGVTVEPRLINFSDFNRTLLQGAAAGDLPDIALINCFDTQLFAEAGIITDITERVTAWGGAEEYFPGVYETSLYNGQNYGLPHLVDCYVLWYNVDQFSEAGVEPPPTWEELSATAAALSGDNRYGLVVCAIEGVEGATAWTIRLLATGAEVTDVNSEGGKAAMQQFVDLVEAGSMSPGILGWNEDDVATQFSTGQAGMMINSATYVNFFRNEVPDLNWSLSVLPEDEERKTFLSAENLTITSGAQQPDAAWDLMLWLQEPEVLNEYLPERNKLPALRNVAAEPQWADDPVWSVFMEQLESAWAPTGDVALHSAEIFTYIQEAVQASISGDSSVDDALATAQGKIDGVLGGGRAGHGRRCIVSEKDRRPTADTIGGGAAGALAAPRSSGSSPPETWARPRRRRALGDSRLGEYLFVLPAVLFILATILYPIIYTIDLSLHDVTIRNFLAGTAPFVGLDNYRAAIADPALQRAFVVSLLYTSGSLALTFVFGFAFAVLFNRVFPGAGPLRALLMLAWILPSVVSGNIWRWMLDGSNGVVNFALQRLGLIERQIFWLTESETALTGVILATAWTTIPFAMVLLLAGLQGIPVTLYEAAALDGARALRRFFDITVPLMRPVILTVLLLNFIYTFKTFDTIFIMTRGGPGDATTVLPIYAYTVGFSFFRLGDGAVATTLLLIIPVTLSLVYFWLTRREEVS